MAEVDTSIYRNAPNPLDQYQQMMGIATQGLHQKLMQVQQNTLQLQNAKEKLDMIRNTLAAHANDPGVSRESIIKSAGDLIAMSKGAISPQEVANYMSTMPEGGDALKSWLNQKGSELLSQEQRLGQVMTMNDGLHQHLLRIMPNNQVNELGQVTNQLSPEANAQRVPTVGPNNQPMSVPLSSLVTPQGYAAGQGGSGGQAGGFQQNPAVLPTEVPMNGGQPAQPSMGGGTGAPPVIPVQQGTSDDLSPQANAGALSAYRQQNGLPTPAREGGPSTGPNNNHLTQYAEDIAAQNAPPLSASALGSNVPSPPPVTSLSRPASGLPAGAIPSGPIPGQVEASTHAAVASGDAEAQALQRAAGTNQRIFQLHQALNGLQNSNTGPGTNETNAAKSFILAQVPFAKDIDPDAVKSVASYDEANKYLTQYAQNAAANFGPETDAKLAASLTGNASTHISNLAAQDVVKSNIALERMQGAQTFAWQQAKKANAVTDADYNDFAAGFGRTLDPRAFTVDMIDPARVNSMIKSMSPEEEKNFANSYRLGVQSGLINKPQAPQPTAQPFATQQTPDMSNPNGGQ